MKFKKRGPHSPLFLRTTMSLSTSVNPFLNLQLAGPGIKGTTTPPLIATHPSTPLPSKMADMDFTLSHHDLSLPLTSASTDPIPSHHDMKLFTSPEIEKMWDHVLQFTLSEDNSDLHASDYHIVQAVSPYYIKFPTRPCVWFITRPGYFGRAFPSDETKLKSGVVLCLEDSTIAVNMLTEEHPTNYIRLTKPISCNRGYVIYEFTSDLFSGFCTPQPAKPPTNLVAIPEFHAHDETTLLVRQEATFHQQVLEEDYALPPRTWDRDLFATPPEYTEKKFDWFMSSEDDIRKEVANLLKRRETGSG
jgi:hypothetical protein